jgi:predicted O-linked N-acetylglucosamine transferase (SPINDLY family)
MTAEDLLQQAAHCHQNGQLAAAEQHYRAVLRQQPEHPFAHFNLGLLIIHSGQPELALAHLEAAWKVAPAFAQFALALANCLLGLGRVADARRVMRGAIEAGLDQAAAQPLLTALEGAGDSAAVYALANGLLARGELAAAASHYRRALELDPAFVDAHINLGNALRLQGQFEQAIASFQRALELNPALAEAHHNLGFTLDQQGRLLEAEACYLKALAIDPDFASAHNNLGNTRKALGRLAEAEACYRWALQIKPNYAEAHYNLGTIFFEQGRFVEAEAGYRHALASKPEFAEGYFNLGNTLREQNRLAEAEGCYREALKIRPDYVEVHNNLGVVLKDQGQLDAAAAIYREALEIKPDYVDAHINLGGVLNEQWQLDAALASLRQALKFAPDSLNAHSNLLFVLNYHPDMSGEEIFAAYADCERLIALPLRSEWRAHGNNKDAERRLRIGYVSPDFRRHSCRFFIEPLLANHDRSRFEVLAYAELAKEDDWSARYKGYVDHWRPTKGLSDEELAERIREDGIDILIELAGHTANNRLGVFARKPAPVSLSWLGYGYTTGLSAIDYYLTDEICAPPGSEGLFAEQPWRIATPSHAYRPNPDMGEVSNLPALRRGHVTFATLTRSIRVNHHTIRVWAEILRQVKGSRLVLDSLNFKDPPMQQRIAASFAEHGITPDRLEPGFHSPPWDVLRGIDIGLDCFPHNSGTTLFENLYMGVPYITLAARPSVGRLGSSILHGIGHPEWIAQDEAEYVAKAVALASDLQGLAVHRTALRSEMASSPLMDEAGFARKVETAYRDMFTKWAKG